MLLILRGLGATPARKVFKVKTWTKTFDKLFLRRILDMRVMPKGSSKKYMKPLKKILSIRIGWLGKEKRGKPHGGSGDERRYERREETLILDTV